MIGTDKIGQLPSVIAEGVPEKARILRCYAAYCTAWDNEIYFEGIFTDYLSAVEYCSNNFTRSVPLDLNVHKHDQVVFWIYTSLHDYEGLPDHRNFMTTMLSKGRTITHNVLSLPFTKKNIPVQNDN